MKFVVMTSFSPGINDNDLKLWQHIMFHGYASRKYAKPLGRGCYIGDKLKHHLYIMRCVESMPDIISPLYGKRLSVSGKIWDQLVKAAEIASLEVKYDKLFSVAQQGKYSVTSAKTVEDIFAAYKHQPELVANSIKYYEIIPARVGNLIQQYKTKPVTLKLPKMTSIASSLSEEMLVDYPVLWDGWYILSEKVFSKLEPFVDPEYFNWKVYSL